MGKDQLFKTVIADGVLPRKTFSMGHAEDKRYYVEGQWGGAHQTICAFYQKQEEQTMTDFMRVSSQHYQKFEYGSILPSLENFIALADHFGVSLGNRQ